MMEFRFKTRAWEDSTSGILEVERWADGDVMFRSVGASNAVCLSPEQVAEVVAFVTGAED
jgi:hypothetical protein